MGIRAENVEEVRLEVNHAAYAAVCEPEELKYAPRTIVDAQFSLPYTSACALTQGWVYIDDFNSEAIARREILNVASKVKVSIDPNRKIGDSRQITAAKAVIRLRDGHEESIVANVPKGSPSNPMTDDEFARKLSDCARHAAMHVDDGMMREVARCVTDLEKASSVLALLELVSPAVQTTS
jgi:2-methylcitrate dehydratase PrpD